MPVPVTSDVLIGSDAHNVISGGGGDDLLQGGKGYDVLTGGAGSDTVSYAEMDKGVFINLWNPLPQIYSTSADTNTLSQIENVIGSDHLDILIGSFGDNVLDGGLGDDWLSGILGSDTYTFQDGWGHDHVFENLPDLIDAIDGDADYLDQVTAALGRGWEEVKGVWEKIDADDLNTLAEEHDLHDVLDMLGEAQEQSAAQSPDTLDFSRASADLKVLIDNFGELSVYYGSHRVENVSAMEAIVTGSGGDTFFFEDGESFSGTIDGGAHYEANTLDYSAYTTSVTVDLQAPEDGGPGQAQGTKGVFNIDNVIGGSEDDTLQGSDEDNLLDGGAGNDLIEGRGGDDVLEGGLGDDALIGGAGLDLVSYVSHDEESDSHANGVTVDLSLGDGPQATGAGSDVIKEIEGVVGSRHDDKLTGNAEDNMLIGGEGKDTLYAGAGNDFLSGDAGNDTLFGGAGDDLIEGGIGDDTLSGGFGSDTLSYIYPGVAVTVDLALTTKQDTLGAGRDTLSGFENLIGSKGDDTLYGDSEDNVITGGEGSDTLYGLDGKDILVGEVGDDFLYGGVGEDNLSGGQGDDLLNGYIAGGDPADDTDSDTVSYAGAESGVTIDLRIDTASQQTGGAGKDYLVNVRVYWGPAMTMS